MKEKGLKAMSARYSGRAEFVVDDVPFCMWPKSPVAVAFSEGALAKLGGACGWGVTGLGGVEGGLLGDALSAGRSK